MSTTDENGQKGLKGTVKWFNNAKGFGFIEHPSGKDVFVHYSVIQTEGYKSLKDGEAVEYEVTEGPKGFHATRVARVNPPEETVAKAADYNNPNPPVESSDASTEAQA